MIKRSKAPLGASLVVISSVFYASYGIWTKLMGNYFQGYTASALRSVLVLLILVPIAVRFSKFAPLNLKRTWRYLLSMFLGSMVVWGPLYYAIQHVGVGVSLASNYACFVIGMFALGWLFGKEKFTRDKWISALLGLIGLGIVFTPNVTKFGWLAVSAAALSGFGASVITYATKKVPFNATQTTIVTWTASVLANFLMAFVIAESVPVIGWHIQWLYLLIFAIASVIASWTLIRGVKLIDAGAAGILGLLEIVFGVIFGVLFFHEKPGLVVVLGVGIIIVASAIPYLRDYNSKLGTLN